MPEELSCPLIWPQTFETARIVNLFRSFFDGDSSRYSVFHSYLLGFCCSCSLTSPFLSKFGIISNDDKDF